MNDLLQRLSDEADGLERSLRKIRALHVNRREPKDAIRSLARTYFGERRPAFAAFLQDDAKLLRLDTAFQELVRLAQTRTRVSDYQTATSELKRAIGELEVGLLLPRPPSVNQRPVSLHHQGIIESLRKISASAANSFDQGLIDLQAGDRKSWRGTSVEFREALRETLDILAPDKAVVGQPGFRLEPDTKGPTMKQKAVFVLKSRRPKDPQVKAFVEAIDVVENLIGKFVRAVYTRSALSVHTPSSRDEVRRIRDYVSLVLVELLEVSL